MKLSIQDDRGYNQGFKPGKALTVRSKRRCDWFIAQMDLPGRLDILEIGCGTGELSSMIAQRTNHQVLGIDICESFIHQARSDYKHPSLQFQVMDFHNSDPLVTKKFDYILGNGILHHLYANLDDALESIRDLLKNHGKIMFIEPNIYNPYCFLIFRTTPFFRNMARLEPGEMAFSRKHIARLLKRHAFQEIVVEYRDFLLPNTPAFLIRVIIALGSVLEKTPLIKYLSQSIFISAKQRMI